MQNTARIVGYTASGLILLGVLALLLALQMKGPGRAITVQVHFPALGTLLLDDAVTKSGVEIGKVRRIHLQGDTALVTLEFYRAFFIPGDSRFVNFNYSMMGERMVLLVPGNSPERMDLTRIQTGYYSEGVSEMIHKVDELLKLVETLARFAGVLDTGSTSLPALKTTLHSTLYPVAQNWSEFVQDFSRLEQTLMGNMESLSDLTLKMVQALPQAGNDFDRVVQRASTTLSALDSLILRTLPLLEKTESLLAAAQNPDSPLYPLLSEPTIYQTLRRLNHDLNQAVNLAKSDGVKDLIRWRNLRFRSR